ncbi:SGNH/GDSL hydrolase family protein [Patescibacteria group bacterium]
MSKQKKLITIVIFIELIIISGLLTWLYQKKYSSGVLGAVQVTELKKEYLQFPPLGDLKQFYEPKANIVLKEQPEGFPEESINTINSDSLNERFEYSVEKPPDTFRIVALGDSWTYGQWVNTKDNWPEQLEDLLNDKNKCNKFNKYEIINLGMKGYDAAYVTKRFDLRGKKYNPDMVIYFVQGGDFTISPDIFLSKVVEEEDKITDKKKRELEKNGLYHQVWNRVRDETLAKFKEDDVIAQELAHFHHLLQAPPERKILISSTTMNDKIKNVVQAAIKSYPHTAFFSNAPDVASLGMDLPDGHPNKNGYTKIAHYIFTLLPNICN